MNQNKRFVKDNDINKNIKLFYDEVKKHKIEDIICIDETSIKSLQKRNHCSFDIIILLLFFCSNIFIRITNY